MYDSFKRLLVDDGGATAIEYGLIAALVSVVIIAGLTLLGTNLQDTFDSVAGSLGSAGDGGGGGGGGEGGAD